jgi:hypothetical protein
MNECVNEAMKIRCMEVSVKIARKTTISGHFLNFCTFTSIAIIYFKKSSVGI